LRDATVKPIIGASFLMPIHARLRGQIPTNYVGPLFRPTTRPVSGDATPERAPDAD